MALLLTGTVATEIDGMRRALRSTSLGRLAPHVTLVPPVNLRAAALPEALALLRSAASRSGPFRLRIGPPATFAPRRSVLYLEVAEAGPAGDLEELRHRLSRGPLAPVAGRAERPFVPHVTLANHLDRHRIDAALVALADYQVTAEVDRLSLLAEESRAGMRVWGLVADAAFGRAPVVGRGGREIELAVSTLLDPEAAGWAEAAWREEAGTSQADVHAREATVAVVARHHGRIVAVATGRATDGELQVHGLIVARSDRRTGIGSQVVRHLERLAGERGLRSIRLEVPLPGEVGDFFEKQGFAAAPGARGLSAHSEVAGGISMERRL